MLVFLKNNITIGIWRMVEKVALTSLERFKLVAVNDSEFSDDEAEKVFLDSDFHNVDELIEMIEVLEKYRPEIFKKITSRILGRL